MDIARKTYILPKREQRQILKSLVTSLKVTPCP